jgi:uncharacterized protein (UPF0128 family)
MKRYNDWQYSLCLAVSQGLTAFFFAGAANEHESGSKNQGQVTPQEFRRALRS